MALKGTEVEVSVTGSQALSGGRLVVHGKPTDDAYKDELAWPRELVAEVGLSDDLGLEACVAALRPTVLIGTSGTPDSFSERTIRTMAAHVQQPVVMPFSNPTSNCEAVPADVIAWTDGAAIVATGSPFAPVTHAGKTREIGQGNNAFIFPGLGFGAMLVHAKKITDAMVLEASYALAAYIEEKHLPAGRIYPPVTELREVSVRVAVAVAETALREGVGKLPAAAGSDLSAYVRARLWVPKYLPIVYEPTLTR